MPSCKSANRILASFLAGRNILPKMTEFSKLHIWFLAIRPKTLPASVAPVLIGTAMAFADGLGHWPTAAIALSCGLLVQILTNLINDYYDFKKGVDTSARIGPVRVMQAGLLSSNEMKSGMCTVLAILIIGCFYMIGRAGWPVVVIGLVSILLAYGYTAGPFPLSSLGLGEIFVLIFFGPVAVGGTYFV